MKRWQVAGLLALSLWSSAGWLLNDLLPGQMTPVAAHGLRLLLLGGLSLLLLLFKPTVFDRRYALAAVASLGLIGLPFLLLSAAQGRIASTDGVLIFALVPIGVALFGEGVRGDSDGVTLVPYGLLGVTGILILLPVRLPEGTSGLLGVLMLVAAMILTTASLIWTGPLLQSLSLVGAFPVICLANGVLLSVAAFFEGGGWSLQSLQMESVRCLAIDLPQTLLLLWLLKTVSPWRLSARYVLAPLFTVLEGLWFLRPRFEIRTALGIALLAAGAFWIVFAKPSRGETKLGLT